jgi:transposase
MSNATIADLVRQEARAMTHNDVIVKAIEGRISWLQAADILDMSPRNLRRLKKRFEREGFDGLVDQRRGHPRRKRIPMETIKEVCRLKREVYPDFSMQHFHEFITERHGVAISYTRMRLALEAAGIVEKAPGQGKHRRKRERRPMTGMLLHIDGSRHQWVEGLTMWDLIVMLDDADGRILYARFVEEEGTMSTFEALLHVITRHGRFCELYHDCGSHFGHTSKAGAGPDEEQHGQVTRALKTLGIRQIFARSPQARGRSERAFRTIQGRLPQELRLAGITTYAQANAYLNDTFVPDFNHKFTEAPLQSETTFIPLAGIDLTLLFSVEHERTVNNDNTVQFEKTVLQIPKTKQRAHYVRCPVLVHEFPDDTLGISYQNQLLARYSRQGILVVPKAPTKKKAA